MLAIAVMAVLVGDVAQGDTSAGFAIAYVVLRSIMLALYGRAWRAVPEARPLIRFYGSGYGLSVLIWLASLAVDTPERYVMWGVGLAVDLSLPPLSTRIHRRVPTSGRHAVERWALFTMIVLGESVVVYSYAHLPLLMELASTSAGLGLLIERAGGEELGAGPSAAYVGGVAVFLVSLVVTRSVTVTGSRWLGVTLKLGATAVIVGLLAIQGAVPPLAVAGALAAVLAALVVVERMLFPLSEPAS